MAMSIGIPYARQEWPIDSLDPVAVCPVCDERIPLRARKDFESYSPIEYQEHYETEHADRSER